MNSKHSSDLSWIIQTSTSFHPQVLFWSFSTKSGFRSKQNSILSHGKKPVFRFAFGISWGFGAWLYISEIMPLRVRGKAVGLCTAVNWGPANILSAFITPQMISSPMGPGGTLLFFGCVCLIVMLGLGLKIIFLKPKTFWWSSKSPQFETFGDERKLGGLFAKTTAKTAVQSRIPFAATCLPETKGKTLEEATHDDGNDKWHVMLQKTCASWLSCFFCSKRQTWDQQLAGGAPLSFFRMVRSERDDEGATVDVCLQAPARNILTSKIDIENQWTHN